MKKFLSVLFILTFFSNFFFSYAESSSAANESTVSEAEPYKDDEFPAWAKDVRRFEIITVGSWPFTVLLTSIGYSAANAISHQDMNYFQNPFVKNDFSYSVEQQNAVILTSVLLSVGIGLTDLICVLVKRGIDRKKAQSFENSNVIITPVVEKDNPYGDLESDFYQNDYLFGTIENAVF